MVLSDRIAVMKRRRRAADSAPPMEVYRDPANLFVASFIGSPAMNFFEADLVRQDGGLLARLPDQVLALPLGSVEPASLEALGTPRKVVVGVRPTDMGVAAGRDLQVEGEVFLVEPIGPLSYVDVDVGGHSVKGICEPDDAPAIGQRVGLGFVAARVHLFDPTTEQRL